MVLSDEGWACKRTLRASYDLAGVRCDIDTSNSLIMTSQLILKLESLAASLVQVDIVLAGYSERLTVGGERMIRDRVVEKVVDFWGCHDDTGVQ